MSVHGDPDKATKETSLTLIQFSRPLAHSVNISAYIITLLCYEYISQLVLFVIEISYLSGLLYRIPLSRGVPRFALDCNSFERRSPAAKTMIFE
jgi:hypothetical protein